MGLTKQQQQQYNEAMAAMVEMDLKERKNTEDVLARVKEIVNANHYEEIVYFIDELDRASNVRLVTTPPNDEFYQKESDYDYIKECWVNQTVNGGYTGDSFAGWCWLQIDEFLWLQMYYEM